MKKSFNILMILCAVLFALSCNNNKSYTDMLKAEKKAIDRFIDEQGFEILKNYPANGVFGEKQFVLLSSGLYLNVIDSGNGNRAEYGTSILLRASGKWLLDTLSFNGFDPANMTVAWPLEFKYGRYNSNDVSNYFFCEGLMSVLEYVGDSSVVKLIVPFKIGSSDQQTNGYPIYYDKVRYIFEK
ncbi:MAG: DUF4827 domain-containing protein [Tannerellaceae bacterium]|nr:DUF4827 domain-containing protein [Tannerellaceae bacterium]